MRILVVVVIIGIQLRLLLRQNAVNGRVTTHSAVMFSCILYYGIVPIFVYLLDATMITSKRLSRIATATDWQFFLAQAAVLLFTVGFHVAYKRFNNRKKQAIYRFDRKRMAFALKLVMWSTLLIGGISFLLYIRAFGSVSRLLYYADYLRSFSVSGTQVVSYLASILVTPARLITVTPVVLMPLLLTSRGQKRFLYTLLLIFCLPLAVLFNLANAGKIPVIMLLLCFAIPFAQRFFKHPWALMLLCACCAFPLLGVLDSLFNYFQTGIWEDVATDMMSYVPAFAYAYSNILNMENIVGQFGLRWGVDFITGVLNIVPGLHFQPSYEVTAEFYSGPQWRMSGGVPNDVITFGFLQFGILGVVLMAVLVGILCGLLDRMLRQLQNSRVYAVLATSLIVNMFSFVVDADIASVVVNQVQLTLAALCMLWSCRPEPVRKLES